MNHENNVHEDVKFVAREDFIDDFFETIEHAARFDPTEKDTLELFEEIARNQGDSSASTINLDGLLLESDLRFYLTYVQIDQIIKGLMAVTQNKNGTISKQLFTQYYQEIFFQSDSRRR
jgi:hypothetical protein